MADAWLAGVIDGEGSICVTASWRHRNTRPELTIYPFVSVTQVDRRYLDRIVDWYGVGKVMAQRNALIPNRQPFFQYRAKGFPACERLLSGSSKYMIVKYDKAVAMLACISEYKSELEKALVDQERSERSRGSGCRRVRLPNRSFVTMARVLIPWSETYQRSPQTLKHMRLAVSLG